MEQLKKEGKLDPGQPLSFYNSVKNSNKKQCVLGRIDSFFKNNLCKYIYI